MSITVAQMIEELKKQNSDDILYDEYSEEINGCSAGNDKAVIIWR